MKSTFIFFLILLFPIFVFSQNVEVLGGLKVDSIDVQSGLIKNVADPISAQDAATKAYVDELEAKIGLLMSLLTVQELLDIGTTPCDVLNVYGYALGDLYGKTYEGGLIFYLNTSTCVGLVAAPTDQSSGDEWGCFGSFIVGAEGTAIGMGAQNTLAIEAGCATGGIAADRCANLSLGGYSDWFLPSLDELNAMYLNLHVNGSGGFAADWYWSSTQISQNDAYYQKFNVDEQGYFDKDAFYYVRAVRAF